MVDMGFVKWEPKKSLKWFEFVRAVQDFFLSKNFCPVETPVLVKSPGTEPHLEFFAAIKNNNGSQQKMRLSPSPEMHLKKLLCRGAENIFEIHKCFRNNESGPQHLSEFYMLEWYRAGAGLGRLIDDLEKLLKHLKEKNIFSFSLKPFKVFSVSKLFKSCCEMDLTPKSKAQDLIPALKKFQIPFTASGAFEDFFHLLFLNRIEPHFTSETPTIVKNYPPSLRAYSRLNHQGWAERFEFYWRNLELANAFYEIHDPEEQKKVFEQDLQVRKQNNAEEVPEDKELIQEMKTMPQSSGIALGLERLFMAVTGGKNISNIHPF